MPAHIAGEILDLYALGRFSQNATQIETHLGACQTCRDKLTVAVTSVDRIPVLPLLRGSERRRSVRISTDDPARVMGINPVTQEVQTRIIDVSRTGMCLRTGQFIQPGEEIKIHRDALVVFGVVRYCVEVGPEFHVGIQLTQIVD